MLEMKGGQSRFGITKKSRTSFDMRDLSFRSQETMKPNFGRFPGENKLHQTATSAGKPFSVSCETLIFPLRES